MIDGNVFTTTVKNPSPIIVLAHVNQISMKIMFDSGATTSFINTVALKRTKHQPILNHSKKFLMADGSTTFDIIGIVEICVEFNNIETRIKACVVNSLCTDCILGMDYINKYQVNLKIKDQQIQIHTLTNTITIPMNNQLDNVKILCRLNERTWIQPYEEKQILINTQVSSGQFLFSPAYHLIYYKQLMSPSALISVDNHQTWISVYNPTPFTCYLKSNIIIGTAVSSSTTTLISSIVDKDDHEPENRNIIGQVSSVSEENIEKAFKHLENEQQCSLAKAVVLKHHQLFDTTKVTTADTPQAHVICTGNYPPTTSRPYPQTSEKEKAMFDIIQEMLKNKQVRASRSQYSAPVLLIKKRDGTYRFVVDYRRLNNITIPDNYPLPHLEQALQKVTGHKFYSKIDLRAGYFQIPIRESDRHKTAFITTHGLYEFNVLAQGLRNSPPSFQRIMSDLLLPCKQFCYVYLDDVLIYSNNFDQHLQHLHQVLSILNHHRFQLNTSKCEFIRTIIDYLGHTISSHGTTPIKERIERIINLPQPKSLKQANAFIGGIGYYRKYIKDYTKIAAPILAVTNLTRKYAGNFKWETPQRQAFDSLKNILVSQPLLLNYPDPDSPLMLATDASDYCIGGVLYQEINGEKKNIYFHSQMLPKSQRKWPTIEKEALAIYYCVIRMKLYLQAREFIIETDHCPLRDMHRKPSNNRRVDRISLILQQYNIMEIRHVSGKCNCMADYLSRYPHQVEDDDEFLDPDFGFIPLNQVQTVRSTSETNIKEEFGMLGAMVTRAQAKANAQSSLSPPEASEFQSEQMSIDDQPPREEGHAFDISKIKEEQEADKLYHSKVVEIQANPNKVAYCLENGILYKNMNSGIFKKKLLYIPPSMVKQLLIAYHDCSWAGHFGFRRTYWKLKDKYWWPDMKTDIMKHIQACLKCQKFNVDRRKAPGLLHPIETPSGPFQLVGIDYSGPYPITPDENKYILALSDYFTKWVIAIPLPNQTAQTTAKALYENLICIHGVPERILSDRGTHFCNELIEAFTKLLGCHHIKSTAYHPQTNGAIERFNSTFERQLAKLTDENMNNWDVHLNSVVFAYNTGQHTTTKYSPFQLLFGRSPKLPPESSSNVYKFSKPNDYFKHLQQTLKLYQQQALINIRNQQNVYKKRYDLNRQDVRYSLGDFVLKRIPTKHAKLEPIYSDIMEVIQENHPTYLIQDLENKQVIQVHVSQLRKITCD